MKDLHAIVYVSSAVHVPSAAELERLLRRARERNAESEVTGLLLHHDGSFMQYIEGPRDALTVIFDIILKDPLHHRIIELMNEPVAAREFAGWSMAFSVQTAPEFVRLSTAKWQASGLAASVGMNLLREVWRQATTRSTT